MTNVNKLTIKQLHELFEKKTISPSELLRETMQRARDAEPKINAFRDFTLELASESARIADIKFSTGKSNTQILGIPFSVKDNIDIEGIKSCFGSLSTPGKPNISAPVVKSLMASGGCLIGKTNMTEFGAKASSDSPLSGITSIQEILITRQVVQVRGLQQALQPELLLLQSAQTVEAPQGYQLHSADW